MIISILLDTASVKSLAKYRANTLCVFLVIMTGFISLNAQSSDIPPPAETEKKAADLSDQWNKQSIQNAADLYRRASVEREKIKEFDKASNSLQEAGRLLLILGENDAAIENFTAALKIAERRKIPAEQCKAESLLSLAFLKIGDSKKSKAHLDKSLSVRRKTSDKFARALSAYALAEYSYLQQQFEVALENYAESIDLWKQLGEQRRFAEACVYKAYTYFAVGKLNQGLEHATEARNAFSAIGNLRGISLAQIAAGHILSSLNRKQEALESYSSADQNFPDDLDLLEKGALLNGFGAIYENYGDLELSLNYRIRALDVFRKDKYLDGELATMHSIIGLSFQLNKTGEAENYVREAERLSKILNDKYYITLVYRQIGDSFFVRGQDEKARMYYLKSLANTSGIGSKTNYILINNKLGRIYLRGNRTDLARKHFESSLAESVKLKNNFARAENYFYLAVLERSLKNKKKSLEFAAQSIEITEKLYSDVLSAKLKRTYFSNIFDRYELYTNLLMTTGSESSDQSFSENYAISALQSVEKARARSMLENLALSEANFIKDADRETVEREKEIRVRLNEEADKLTDLLSVNADKSETDKISGEIGDLENQLEEIIGKLKQKSPIYSAIKNPAPFDVAEFQRNVLDEKSLLLEFSFGAEQSYLWLVSKTAVRAYVLPPRAQIESRIERLRELIAAPVIKTDESIEDYQRRVKTAENDYKIESKQLSREIFGQVSGELADKRLIIVPDGKLHYFPVAALPLPDSADDIPFLLANEIVYEPSAETLALLMRNNKNAVSASKNLLVFSDPIFSVQDSRVTTIAANVATQTESPAAGTFRFADSLTSLARLNATGNEADAILEIVGASGSTTLSGAAATREKALDASVSEYKIIHFATHGLINEERPALSGIVLSQVDENGQPRDGVVRLQDIYAMNLSADAVVLSACSTGVGKEVKGEGLMSLNNAFLQIGAKSVVASLWKVDDNAAQELMKNFYRELSSGTTTSQALRLAQIRLRQNGQYQTPFYWAAFTVQGDFVTAPQISGKLDYRVFAWLIFPFIALGIYFYRRRSGYSTAKL